MSRRSSADWILVLCGALSGLAGCDRSGKDEPEAPESSAIASDAEPPPKIADAEGPGAEPVTEPSVGPDSAVPSEDLDVGQVVFGGEASEAFVESFSSLRSWVAQQRGTLHAAVVDLETNQWLAKNRVDEPVNVASNAKLITSAAALSLLGPAYQFKTEVFGSIDEGGKCERLVIRGGGAPDLSTADLYRFIAVLKGRGLVKVSQLVVDQSLFTPHYTPPAFDQQPNEWAPFRANISALALDGNAVTLNVATTAPGKAARIWYEPPGVVRPSGEVMTSAPQTGDQVTWTLRPEGQPEHLASVVGGRLSVDASRRRYSRRLEDPRLAPGLAFEALLLEAGVQVSKLSLGERQKEPRLALWISAPLAELLRALGKHSDNFTAEMIFAALSQAALGVPSPNGTPKERSAESKSSTAEGREPEVWSPERGAQAVRQWLASIDAPLEGVVIENGSGLFDANLYTPDLLVTVLAHMQQNPHVFSDYVSHLAMGGTDGTLERRMQGSELAARVRAKTGTLHRVDALSGYVARTGGRPPLAFSVTVKNARAGHFAIRQQVDRAVLEWARLIDAK